MRQLDTIVALVNKSYILVVTIIVLHCRTAIADVYPFQNISLSWGERAEDLVDRLTLDELVGCMARGGSLAGPNLAIPRLGIPPYQFNTECLHGVVKPNLATAFPQSIGLGATFSPDLIEMMATVIGIEVRAINNDAIKRGDYGQQKGLTCFSPMINIARDPRWGRVQEGYGEDPFLTGAYAEAYVKGLQGDHPRYIRAGAGCKHFAVHSGPEAYRFGFNSVVSERDLQLTFLPHFKKCVDAGSVSLMCSYNSINGVPACGNKLLLTDILRTQWGFNGFVISDDGAITFIHTAHGYVKTDLDAAVLAANAGTDVELPWTANATLFTLYQAVAQGNISMDVVRERVKNLFTIRMRLGNLDPPELNPYASIPLSVVQSDSHRKLALIAAEKSFVLLKNDNNFLPFKQDSIKSLAIIGPGSDDYGLLFGTYSPAIDLKYSSTPYLGLKSAAPTVILETACVGGTGCASFNTTRIQEVIQATEQVILCLGLGSQFEEEDHDRGSLGLPGVQDQLLVDVLLYAKKPIVLLVFSGGPVDLTIAKEAAGVAAIIQCFYSAQATGEALREILFTRIVQSTENSVAREIVTSPAGRSPYTWPKSVDQIPSINNYSMEGRTYRYFRGRPLYPFGYGLSYSRFNYSDLTIQPSVISKPEQSVNISVKVHNLGPYDSDEVTQVYIAWQNVPVRMPDIQLVAVARRMIAFSATAYTLNLSFNATQLRVWDDVKGFVLYTGVIDVYVGGQQPFQETDVGSNVLHDVIKIMAQ